MKKISLILVVLLLFILSGCTQKDTYTKDEVNELIEVIILVTEDDNLTYEDGNIIEVDRQTGGITIYTIKEYLEKKE